MSTLQTDPPPKNSWMFIAHFSYLATESLFGHQIPCKKMWINWYRVTIVLYIYIWGFLKWNIPKSPWVSIWYIKWYIIITIVIHDWMITGGTAPWRNGNRVPSLLLPFGMPEKPARRCVNVPRRGNARLVIRDTGIHLFCATFERTIEKYKCIKKY